MKEQLIICIGFPKCGTTWLHILFDHNEIFTRLPQDNGEINYRLFSLNRENFKGKNVFVKTPAWIFDKNSLLRIRKFIKDNKLQNVKIIICYRNIAEYLYSFYLHRCKEAELKIRPCIDNYKTFDDYLKHTEFDIPMLHTGNFAQYVKQAIEIFKDYDIYFINHKQICSDQEKIMEKLGIEYRGPTHKPYTDFKTADMNLYTKRQKEIIEKYQQEFDELLEQK